MLKIIRATSVLVLILVSVFLFFNTVSLDIQSFFNEGAPADTHKELVPVEDIKTVSGAVEDVTNVVESVFSPGPLRVLDRINSTKLTSVGVFIWTNTQRAENGVGPLLRSSTLDKIANVKLKDMFARQYFAHESPTGDSIDDLAGKFGYEYILIGENLALGDFKGDKELVQAWMDSPGHRANILNERYREIGVAVGKGEFEGRETWLAVQSFGTPLSLCEKVDGDLKQKIDDRTAELEELESAINELKLEIESLPRHSSEYADKVNEYNSMVNQYNLLFNELGSWIDTYNSQINLFNACISSI